MLGKEFENRTIGFPYGFDRAIKWWRYKLIFNRNISMQFRSTSRFLTRYRKKRIRRMSFISRLYSLNVLFNKILLNIIFVFKYKYINLKSYLKINYNSNLVNINKYFIYDDKNINCNAEEKN